MENEKVSNNRHNNFVAGCGVIVFIIFIAIVYAGFSGDDNSEMKKQNGDITASQKNTESESQKTQSQSGEIKYKQERLYALSSVQAYKTQKTINEGNLKFEIKMGTKLYDVFKLQKQSGLLNSDGRWLVVKDGERFVVSYKSSSSAGNLGGPQWSIMKDVIKALNGTAIKYTPELGYSDPKLAVNDFTKARKLYLRFMELGESVKYQDAINSDDPNLRQKTEDKVMGIVANEFGVSFDDANSMFFEGMQEGNDEVQKVNSERGDILSDEKLVEILKEQGDLYVPEN